LNIYIHRGELIFAAKVFGNDVDTWFVSRVS
jgi:hypothetical protein